MCYVAHSVLSMQSKSSALTEHFRHSAKLVRQQCADNRIRRLRPDNSVKQIAALIDAIGVVPPQPFGSLSADPAVQIPYRDHRECNTITFEVPLELASFE